MTVTSRPHKKPHDNWGKERNLFIPVVGIQYHLSPTTRESIAEAVALKVDLVREPDNQFDPNAIKVILLEHTPGLHIGYLSRDIAAKLAPQMDEGRIWLEASALRELEGNSGELVVSFRKKIRSDP